MLAHFARKIKRARELGLRRTGVHIRRRIADRLGMLPPVPPTVFVEVTNNCNLSCVMCDRDSMSRKRGFIDMDLYRRIIDNASKIGVPEVKLNRFGEPFLHPRLAEMVRYAKQKGIPRVYFTSNATLLTEENTRNILSAGLDGIAFSIDGADSDTYKAIRNFDFDLVTANVERFCRIKKEMGLKTRVQLNTILLKSTENQMPAIFKRWSSLVDHINVLPVAKYGNVPDLQGAGREGDCLKACNHPFDRLMVFWNGEVTVCCGDINGALKIGDIRRSNLEELWKNRNVTHLRRLHKARQFDTIPLCGRCDGTSTEYMQFMQSRREAIYSNAGKR